MRHFGSFQFPDKSNTIFYMCNRADMCSPWMISFLFQGVFAVTGSSTVMVVKPVLKEGKY